MNQITAFGGCGSFAKPLWATAIQDPPTAGRGSVRIRLAKNPALGERVAATPAIADDCLYSRTEKHIYAFAAKR